MTDVAGIQAPWCRKETTWTPAPGVTNFTSLEGGEMNHFR